MESKRLDLEASIMVALFKATISQSQFLIDELKHKPKKDFLLFHKQGKNMIETFEKSPALNIEYVESLEEIVHEVFHEIRKQQLK